MKLFLIAFMAVIILGSCKKEFAPDLNDEEALAATDESNITSNAEIKGQTPVFAKIGANVGGYTLKLPNDYSTTKKKYPLLIYLHGSGVYGNGTTDLYKVTKNGVAELLQLGKFPEKFTVNGKSYKFIVVTPQFKTPYVYATDINPIIDYAKKLYRVDSTRMYLTGMSMGGGAIVNYCDTFASRIAAAVPMASCWPPPFERIAHSVVKAKLPLWVFHSRYDKDPETPPSYSIDLVNLINSYSPAIPAKITLFNTTSHNCWTKGYKTSYKENNMNIYQWMLQYVRKP